MWAANVKWRWCNLCGSEVTRYEGYATKRELNASISRWRQYLRQHFGPIHGRILSIEYERGAA